MKRWVVFVDVLMLTSCGVDPVEPHFDDIVMVQKDTHSVIIKYIIHYTHDSILLLLSSSSSSASSSSSSSSSSSMLI
jgi:ketosteroid isomerase-like protein